jgi:hypothetical protein
MFRSRKSKKNRQYNGQKIPTEMFRSVNQSMTDNTMNKRYQKRWSEAVNLRYQRGNQNP